MLDFYAISNDIRGLLVGLDGGIDYFMLGFWSSSALLIILTSILIIRAKASFIHNRKFSSQFVSRDNKVSAALLELHDKGAALSQKMDYVNFIYIDMSTNPILTPAIMEIEGNFSEWEENVKSFLDRCLPAYACKFKAIRVHVRRRRIEEQLQLLSGIINGDQE